MKEPAACILGLFLIALLCISTFSGIFMCDDSEGNSRFSDAMREKAYIESNQYIGYANPLFGSEYGETTSSEGCIRLLATNTEGEPIMGAVFQLVRETETDMYIDLGENFIHSETALADCVMFCTDEKRTSKPIWQVTTGPDGKASFCGLGSGTYCLVETKAPEGYSLITTPILIRVTSNEHDTEKTENLSDNELTDNTLRIINVRSLLPQAEGAEITMLTAVGGTIICAAFFLLVLNVQKRG